MTIDDIRKKLNQNRSTWDKVQQKAATGRTEIQGNTWNPQNRMIQAVSYLPRAISMGKQIYNKEQESSTADKVAYVGKKTSAGVLGGVTGIAQSFLTDTAGQLKQGEQKTKSEAIQNLTKKMMLPQPMNMLSNAKDNIKENVGILTDSNKNVWQKIAGVGQNSVSGVVNNLPFKDKTNAVIQAIGSFLRDKSDKVLDVNKVISKPSEKLNESLAQESQKYGTVTNYIGDAAQSVGNMLPSIGVTAVTGDPTAGMFAMGLGAKGSATTEALNKGVDLQDAIKRGDTDAMIETGTEMLTGGLNIFGKGALDKFIENGVVKKVKNEVARFFVQQGVNISGEVLEETISDLLGTILDKGTVDPDATYSLKDWSKTAITTTLSTTLLNILTGGLVGDIKAGQNRNELRNQVKSENLNDAQSQNINDKIQQDKITNQKELKDEIKKIDSIENSGLSDERKASLLRFSDNNNLNLEQVQDLIEADQDRYGIEKKQVPTIENEAVSQNEQQITQEEGKVAQNELSEKTRQIVTNLMRSIDNYNKTRQEGEKVFDINDENTRKEIEAIQKIASDRGINITFDESRFDNSTDNAFYVYDKNNNVAEIVLNPNTSSKKYVQNLAVHELVHSFSGDKKSNLMNSVLDYAKTLEGYGKAYQDITNAYKSKYGNKVSEDVINEEVVANILGEKLGDKQFVDDMINGKYATQNRGFVEKIYEFVKNQINRFRGYKDQEQYWKHVKELFDDAYKNSEINKGQSYSREATAMTNIKDSTGRNLSEGQVEYFKESKARDENGNLITLYHGTPAGGFNTFDIDFRGTTTDTDSTGDYGKGFYFTPDKQLAERYSEHDTNNKGNKEVYEVYLDMKNPLRLDLLDKISKDATELIRQYGWSNVTDEMYDEMYGKYGLTEDDVNKMTEARTMLGDNWQDMELSELGFDGVINENRSEFVVFKPEQIKRVDNITPTDNQDIRYSTDLEDKGIIIDFDNKKVYSKNSYTEAKEYKDIVDKIKQIEQEIKDIKEGTTKLPTKEITDEEMRELYPMWDMLTKSDKEWFREFENKDRNSPRKQISLLEEQESKERDKLKELKNKEYNKEFKNKDVSLGKVTQKTNFEGFRTETTIPYYDELLNDKEQAKKDGYKFYDIVEMTPDEYLIACSKYAWKSPIENGLRGADYDNVNKYTERLKNGEKAPLPYLKITEETSGQEGRHRALAAKKAGIKTIPVLLMSDRNLEVNNGQILFRNQGNTNERFSVETGGSTNSNTEQRSNIQGVLQEEQNTKGNSSRNLESNKSSRVDSQGRTLSKEQQEYFKDSKVRDSEGNLKTMYHGTEANVGIPQEYWFSIFDEGRQGNNGSWFGNGFYFTENEEHAKEYAHSKGNVYEVYLDVKKPYIPYQNGNSMLSFQEDFKNNFEEARDIEGKLTGQQITDILKKNGYDGIIIGDNTVVFNPNQIKNVDNTNPTSNPDIRYSKDTTGAWNNFIEKYFKNEGEGTSIQDLKKLPVKPVTVQEFEEVLNNAKYIPQDAKEAMQLDFKDTKLTNEMLDDWKETVRQANNDFKQLEKESLGKELTTKEVSSLYNTYRNKSTTYKKNSFKTALDTIQGNRYGRNKAEWLKVANMAGIANAGLTLQELDKIANESWFDLAPNTKSQLNRQGEKYVDFTLNDWRNAFYNGVKQARYSIDTENTVQLPQEVQLPKKKTLNPTEISNLKPEDASTTPKLPNRQYKQGTKVSNFVSNINNDVGFLTDNQKKDILKDENVAYYAPVTNAESLEKAYKNLTENGKNATMSWYAKNSENANAEDVATGWILLKQYADNGDTQGMVNVAKKLRDMGTKAGQTVQAFNILSRLTPEGMVAYTQGELQDAYNEMIKNKSQKWIDEHRADFDLTQDEIKFIMDTMQNLPAENPADNNYDRKVALGKIQKLFTEKLPSENNAIKAWMRISMLFNPKTQVRNIAGNAIVVPVNMTSDFLGSKVDKYLSKYTGVRTLGNMNKSYLKGMKEGFYQSYNDFKLGINTRDIEQNKFEFGQGKAFKDKGIGKQLNRVDNLLNFVMDWGDRGFSQAAFVNSLNNQMVLNGVTTPTQDMIDIATQESLSRTWNDNNDYTRFVLGVRRALNNIAGTKNYGLGDVLIPFAKTPANLTKAIVEYSPVGLVKTITDIPGIKNAIETGQFTAKQQHQFADHLGKGLAGTMLYILGYALASAGIATGESDKDKDVKNFLKNSLGIGAYSIKIGDKSFAYDWAQPIATPLAIMTNLYQTNKDNPDASLLDKTLSAVNIGTNQLLEQSFMESLNEVLNGNGEITERLQKAVLDLPARAIPTFSKQIADLVDGTQRTSYEYKQPVKSAVNSVKAKLPFASMTLTPVVDTLGNEVQKYGGKNNWFNVFFNPANMNKGVKTKAGEEIYNVYEQTGDTSIFPVTAPYYVNYDGEKITMDSAQRAEYQRTSGTYTEEAVNDLLNDKDYQRLDDEDKAEILSKVVTDSNEKAKRDVLGIENKNSDLQLIDEIGSDYYTFKLAEKRATDEKKKETNNKSAQLTQTEKVKVLRDKNYSDNDKDLLYTEEILSDEDKIYDSIKSFEKNVSFINTYLDYKMQKFESDKKDDGTVSGKSISGSKKEKVVDYLNNSQFDDFTKLYIYGTQYKLNNTERAAFERQLNQKALTPEEKKKIYLTLSGTVEYKDGSIGWK